MRHPMVLSLCAASALTLAACEDTGSVERKIQDVNVVDETNLNDVMLTVADPNEAVSYFRRSLTQQPGRLDLQRGLAKSLVRANRPAEAVSAWNSVVENGDSDYTDQVELAASLIRADQWDRAANTLNAIPPTHETFKRYRLEAVIADSQKDWKKADSFYETAVGLTTKPGSTLNNWGYSKLTRGDYKGAETLFMQAIRQDDSLFTAKNNLALARGAQGNYALPVIPISQTERAQLLYTMGLSAVKRGDVEIGKGLFKDAIETHPQHFEAAARSLSALETTVTN